MPAALLAGLGIRLAWIALFDAKPVSDFLWYYQAGSKLAASHAYPTAWRPIGYPLMLGMVFRVLGTSPLAARLLNVALSVGILALSWRIAAIVFRSEAAGRITLATLALWPNQVAYTSLVASETPALLFMLLGTSALILPRPRLWTAAAAGAVFGFGALVRPVALTAPAALLIALRPPRGAGRAVLALHARRFAVVFAAALVVVAPWLAHSWRLSHRLVFATETGETLLIGNNPYATGGWVYDDRVRALAPNNGNEFEYDAAARSYAASYISDHPGAIIRLIPRRVWNLYRSDHEGIHWVLKTIEHLGPVRRAALETLARLADDAYAVVGLAFLPAAAVLWWRRRKERPATLAGLGVWMLLALTVFYLPFFGTSRFHFPAIPWLVMYPAALLATAIGAGPGAQSTGR